jgi:hypothetical protein
MPEKIVTRQHKENWRVIMKKFWIMMLSLGLIAAFSMPAAATDVKLGGSYFVAGYYESNHAVRENAPSMAYYGQRIRLEPLFKVAEGLDFNLRVDAMERVWGQFGVGAEANNPSSTRNPAAEQNVQFRRGWMTFLTGIGQFRIGYLADGAWGTDFGDLPSDGPEIIYTIKVGGFVAVAVIEKAGEGRLGNAVLPPGYVDSDVDKYCLSPLYFWDQGQAGFLWCSVRVAVTRPLPLAFGGQSTFHYNAYEAYFKTTLGPVYLEGEYQLLDGVLADWDNHVTGIQNIDYRNQQWYLMAKFNMGPAYIGAQYAVSLGDDPDTPQKMEACMTPGWELWKPTLVLFNDWTNRWSGAMGTYGATGTTFVNADLYQVFAGYSPMPKLGIKASITMANANEKPKVAGVYFVDDEYGKEFDLTVTYRIYDNLEYMIGFGYLWAGDYYKGTNAANKIDDDYLLLHQLTLSF